MKWKSEELQHPKWQRIRLEVMERDNWACIGCGAQDITLHVHHIRYIEGRKPWEYCMADLTTLCSECHKSSHEAKNIYHNASLQAKLKFWKAILSKRTAGDKKVVEIQNIIFTPDIDSNFTIALDVPSFLYITLPRDIDHIIQIIKSEPEAINAIRYLIRQGHSLCCHGPIAK